MSCIHELNVISYRAAIFRVINLIKCFTWIKYLFCQFVSEEQNIKMVQYRTEGTQENNSSYYTS